MIFLLKDGRYKIIKQFPGDRKFSKKYEKYKKQLAAIMIECFSLLHSDVYTVILPDNFNLEVEPMTLTYSICYSTADEPINESNSLTCSVQINDCIDLYTASSLIYQLAKNDDVMTILNAYDTRTITLLSITIQTKQYRRDWYCDKSTDSAIEFIKEFGFVCDTDDFLDASIPKSARVEMGNYFVRYDRCSGETHGSYYYFDRKAKLYLSDSRWCLEIVSPSFFKDSAQGIDQYFNNPVDVQRAIMVRSSIQESDLSYVGFCINGTGLLYLCVLPEAEALSTLDSLELILDIREERNGEIEFDTKDNWSQTYMASTDLEALYFGLYIPQMLEINRFLFSKRIRAFSCEFIHNKSSLRSGSHEFPQKVNPNQSIEFDLLAVFAKILLTIEPQTISYDDMPWLYPH